MSTLSPQDKKFYVIVAITLLIMFGFGYLPTFGQVTPMGMKILGIFLGCIFAWCFGELVWSSLIGLASLVIFGFGTMQGNFAAAFANTTIITMLTAIIFCYAVEKSGLMGEIARWIVGQRWAQKSPWALVAAFFIAAAVLGILITNVVPTLILLWSLFYETAKEANIKPHDPLAIIILCGIGIVGYIGACVLPYAGMVVLVKGAVESFDPTFQFNVLQYIGMNLITAIVYIPVAVLALRLIVGKKVNFTIPEREPYKMNLNTESKIALVFLLVIIASMIFTNLLDPSNPLYVLFNTKLTIVGTFIIASGLLMIINVNGKPVMDVTEALRNVPWPLVLLVGSALAISGYITADGMGIIPTIVSVLGPLVEGKSALVITLMFVAIGLIMTNFINDVVTCVVIYPIAAQFIMDAGGSIMLFAIMYAQVVCQGCLMPSGSAIGAMFHGNSAWMKSKDIFFYVTIMEAVLLVVLIVISLIGTALGI